MNQIEARSNPKYTIPEPRAAIVRRQRLLDFLHENIDQPLQLICAPAGYGKTTLLADFAKDTDLTVCWYAIDELDRDAGSLLVNLFEAIRARFPNFDYTDELVENRSSGANMDWRSMANMLVDGIRERISEFFLIVIDDFHILSGGTSGIDAIDLMLQRLPDNCRVLISSRELPQLASLPRLISQRKVAGLGPSELKFTSDEIKGLLKRNFDLDITPEEAHRLEQDSEGWITAILLTTHSLWKGLFRDVLAQRGQNSILFEFMASEVFSQQSLALQNFLLSTSICNEFDADMGDALTETHSSNDLLKEIESKNLFITRLEGQHSWYRYHHLFRDFLREKLEKEDPSRHQILHVRAAQYHIARGEPRQAIQYYIQGSEFENSLDLLEEQAEALAHEGLWDTLGNWLEQIPPEYRGSRPKLLLYLSTVYQRAGRNDDSIKLLTDIIEVFRNQEDEALEAQALTHRSAVLRFKGAHQMAIRDARQALAIAQRRGAIIDEAEARSNLGRAYAQQGKFPRAEREFKLALIGYQQQGNLFQLSQIQRLLGTVYVELGNSSKAATHFEKARQGFQRLGNQSELGITLNNLAVLYHQQSRLQDAEPLAYEAASLASATSNMRSESHALTTLGDIQRDQGLHDAAISSYENALKLARECMEAPAISNGSIGLGETYRLSGDPSKAKIVLKEAIELAYDLGQEFELGMAYTSLGIIEYESHNYDEGIGLLRRATEHLARSKQKRNLARARFLLAHALFLTKSYVEAIEQLEIVAQLCQELGYYLFLLADAQRAPLMVQYSAVAHGPYREFYVQIRDQLNQRISRRATEASPDQSESLPSITAPEIDVRSFGSLRIALDDNPILSSAWGSSKAREMFLFMLSKDEPIHKGKIIEALWPDISPSKANSNFHSTLHRMKAALYPNCVERDGELYQLNPGWNYQFDVHKMNSLLTDAEKEPQESPERAAYLLEAVELYKGHFLEDVDSEWCAQLRANMEFKFWKAVSALSDRYEANGEPKKSIALLEQALTVDEFQEEIYYTIMDLYLEIGEESSASKTYKRCLSVFGETVFLAESPRVSKLLTHLN
ncbi:MAG: tetratricopeptide repeat protein [Chloroflexi bacterium]|nr:tetratricopeptide repeat protein [Chloroflexota bacterium]